jgi:hypothetical protein
MTACRRGATVSLMPDELDALKSSLLHRLRLPTPLAPNEGDAAFDQHVLLATKIHRAALLNARSSDGQGDGWVRFLTTYFPSGRNGMADAQLLWDDWRTGLLKDRAPRAHVSLTHGHPEQHWKLDSYAALCIELESMWDDFEYAVNQFVQALRSDKARARIVLSRYEKRTWTERPFLLLPQTIGAAGRLRATTLLPVGSVTSVSAVLRT